MFVKRHTWQDAYRIAVRWAPDVDVSQRRAHNPVHSGLVSLFFFFLPSIADCAERRQDRTWRTIRPYAWEPLKIVTFFLNVLSSSVNARVLRQLLCQNRVRGSTESEWRGRMCFEWPKKRHNTLGTLVCHIVNLHMNSYDYTVLTLWHSVVTSTPAISAWICLSGLLFSFRP